MSPFSQHSLSSLPEPLFGNQLATKLRYSRPFPFPSCAPAEQQDPQAGSQGEIWSITRGPGQSPPHPEVGCFHPGCEVPEPALSCDHAVLVAAGSSLQPQVTQPVDKVLVWAAGDRLHDVAGVAAQHDESSVGAGSRETEN